MIALELQPRTPRNHLDEAALFAEVQLAHYLAREFGADPRVMLFFGLRFEHAEVAARPSVHRSGSVARDATQIDVLAVHPHGMAVIESKSVHAEVIINARGEWARTFRGEVKGMMSPIEQTRMQAESLRRLLIAHKRELRDKKLLGMLQGGFAYCPMELFVAISDSGRIVRKRGAEAIAPEAIKADQIAARVRARVEAHRKAGGLLGMLRSSPTGDGEYSLTDAEMERVRAFLLSRHTPR